jgi:DNA-directed RNA polymerase, alpha subunit, bacterial and chloroplast-type
VFEFEKPHIEITQASEDGKYGKFIAGPFERGYGTTLGNSLRRVLLSSIPGTAVSNIKVDGIVHEFTSIPGVKEDVIEIILNLKRLAIKNFTDRFENRIAHINVSGQREITSEDIVVDSDLKIINKDLHIATLNSPDSKLSMELTITSGRGYVNAEKNKELSESIGTIPIDSIYTPIERVNFSVENTRVGNITDYDKLIFEIWTNGTLSAADALSCAARIMTEHLTSFIDISDNNTIEDPDLVRNRMDNEKFIKQPIEDLEFSVRAYNCLKRTGINTIEDLLNKTEEEMLKVRNLGKKSYYEVITRLNDLGLSLKESDE